jgi:serralysin
VSASVSYTLAAGTVVETLRTVNAAATTAINLTGNNFANAVTGNAGSNVINGGTGNDTLRGNAGNDFFLFNTALSAAANVDTVADFVVVNDTIRLENAIFVGLAAGTLNADAFHIGAAAADAEDRIIYNSATGALSFDSNGNAAGGLAKFAQLTAGLLLTNADFAVI